MPDKKKYKFILNDESVVNTYGFKVLNGGVNRTRFDANPVLLFAHDSRQVMGRWLDLAVEDGKLIGYADFDANDPDAVKLESKVENGYIKGCSIGLIINDITLLDDASGKSVPVVTNWELLEASVVAIPSNASALKLYDNAGAELTAQQIQLSIQNLQHKIEIPMKEIRLTAEALTALGLTDGADAATINAAIAKLSSDKAALQTKLDAAATLAATQLVDDAIAAGKVLATGKEAMVAFALQNMEQAKALIDSTPAKQTLADKVDNKGATTAGKEGWNFKQWQKEDPRGLEAMRLNDNAAYEKLRTDYAATLAK